MRKQVIIFREQEVVEKKNYNVQETRGCPEGTNYYLQEPKGCPVETNYYFKKKRCPDRTSFCLQATNLP